jgi:hypothetical protein
MQDIPWDKASKLGRYLVGHAYSASGVGMFLFVMPNHWPGAPWVESNQASGLIKPDDIDWDKSFVLYPGETK